MAYAAGDVILDDHYNAFVTSLNAMFGAGSGRSRIQPNCTGVSISR